MGWRSHQSRDIEMLMTKQQLARVADNTLKELKASKLDSLEAVGKVVGQIFADTIDDAHNGEEYIQIIAHPASPGAVVISYFRRTGQTPLQIVVNPDKKYIRVTLTCKEIIQGYTAFDEEPEYGKMQDRPMSPLDFKTLFTELEKLSKLK